MNEDYREFEANELLRISIAKQEAFDAAVRKRRERVAAWKAEDNRLLDDIAAALRAADKVGWHLKALGAVVPDLIQEEGAREALRSAAVKILFAQKQKQIDGGAGE